MAKKNENRVLVALVCEDCKQQNYTVSKNKNSFFITNTSNYLYIVYNRNICLRKLICQRNVNFTTKKEYYYSFLFFII